MNFTYNSHKSVKQSKKKESNYSLYGLVKFIDWAAAFEVENKCALMRARARQSIYMYVNLIDHRSAMGVWYKHITHMRHTLSRISDQSEWQESEMLEKCLIPLFSNYLSHLISGMSSMVWIFN